MILKVTPINFLVGSPMIEKCNSNFCLILLSLSKVYRHLSLPRKSQAIQIKRSEVIVNDFWRLKYIPLYTEKIHS